jgi:hypothetical protein
MSNKKKGRRDGVIPMKNKAIATPINPSNATSSTYEYTRKQEVTRISKTNQLY